MDDKKELKDILNQLVDHWLKSDSKVYSDKWIDKYKKIHDKYSELQSKIEKPKFEDEELDSEIDF